MRADSQDTRDVSFLADIASYKPPIGGNSSVSRLMSLESDCGIVGVALRLLRRTHLKKPGAVETGSRKHGREKIFVPHKAYRPERPTDPPPLQLATEDRSSGFVHSWKVWSQFACLLGVLAGGWNARHILVVGRIPIGTHIFRVHWLYISAGSSPVFVLCTDGQRRTPLQPHDKGPSLRSEVSEIQRHER